MTFEQDFEHAMRPDRIGAFLFPQEGPSSAVSFVARLWVLRRFGGD